MVVLEGMGAAGFARLRQLFPREEANTPAHLRLEDAGTRFPRRLYTPFGPFPKVIHLRHRLSELVDRPELYNRSLVRAPAVDAARRGAAAAADAARR